MGKTVVFCLNSVKKNSMFFFNKNIIMAKGIQMLSCTETRKVGITKGKTSD